MTALVLTAAVGEAGLAALVRASGEDGPVTAALEAEEAHSLQALGVLEEGRPTGMLADGLEVVREPICDLAIERGQRRGRGWVGGRLSVLSTPAPGGAGAGARLTLVPTLLLCETLARMNDVSPRPRIERPVRLRFSAGGLAETLASRSPDVAARSVEGDERAGELARELAATLREHWRVEARWSPAPTSPGVRVIEIVDTERGLWSVVPDGSRVELWPATPTAVWRMLAMLLPRDDELA